MKFVCDGLVLFEAAVTVSKACAAKTVTPILECIKFEVKNDSLTLTAYDGEISIKKKIKADVFEEGEICVNGRVFTDFIGKVAGMNVSISASEKGMEISYEDSKSSLQVLPAAEFPSVVAPESDDYFLLKTSDFKNVVGKTVFCCATDESRPILKGCLLEVKESKLFATALDGYRMASMECGVKEANKELKIVCPARTLTEIARMTDDDSEELKVSVSKNMLFLELEDTVLTSRLYTGEFVKKENIFPPAFTTVLTLEKRDLVESMERALVLIRGDKNNLIIFEIKGGNIAISANSEIGNVAENVKVDMEGKELKIALNGKFLLDALKALDEERVILSFNTAVSPFTVENEKEKGNSYLILPVRTAV